MATHFKLLQLKLLVAAFEQFSKNNSIIEVKVIAISP